MLSPYTAIVSEGVGDHDLALVASVTLLVLIVARHMTAGFETPFARRLERVLTIPIVPLVIVFAAAAISHSGQVLGF